ncbi:uncharacterized protein with TBP-like fold DUF4468 [Mucilaginibacter oryzae]|uniref:Uncharacterized protein with TBP-like fold DUF4468 n=1 Tax=Mucilaginibacter oryzae TaxID=468058 RepID=A0A316HN65_9SPHI|nr:DUF4468 domain-containing protein [Mucilaginibacter oryzae]PWK79655.1 uncharacterized protein with TBP-like fold DUF4468 [Mucilaginibacter oryzae]
MKTLLSAFFVLLFSVSAFAQKDSLALDEYNKYIYYKTAEQPGAVADTLYYRALSFLTKAYTKKELKLVKADKGGNALNGSGVIVINKKNFFGGSSEGGELAYSIKIEVKDNKYRYWLTDFVYQPYQRNRYGNSEIMHGKDVALEKASEKLSKADFNACINQVLVSSKQVGDKLKAYMLKASTVEHHDVKKVKRVSTKEW